jgi:large subunit ribosomal protein L24
MNLRKGDEVKILSGKDRGKTGKVLHINQKTGRATVEGLNLSFRHQKPKKSGQKGQRLQLPTPLGISNLMLVCPFCKKPTRVGHMTDEKGLKTRVCKKCKKRI